MEATTLNTLETTSTLWAILEEDHAFEGKSILFEVSSDDEDGTYPLVMHYVTFANKIDEDGTSAWLNRMAGRKNKLNFEFYGGLRIIRDAAYETKAKIVFEKPIVVVVANIGEKQIIEHVTEIEGEFTHDWFWSRNGRQDKIANGFEIRFEIKKFIK